MLIVMQLNLILFHMKIIGHIPIFLFSIPDSQMIRDKGHPRSSRIRNEMDLKKPSVKIRCGLCKIEGHNHRNCLKKNGGQSSNPLSQGN